MAPFLFNCVSDIPLFYIVPLAIGETNVARLHVKYDLPLNADLIVEGM